MILGEENNAAGSYHINTTATVQKRDPLPLLPLETLLLSSFKELEACQLECRVTYWSAEPSLCEAEMKKRLWLSSPVAEVNPFCCSFNRCSRAVFQVQAKISISSNWKSKSPQQLPSYSNPFVRYNVKDRTELKKKKKKKCHNVNSSLKGWGESCGHHVKTHLRSKWGRWPVIKGSFSNSSLLEPVNPRRSFWSIWLLWKALITRSTKKKEDGGTARQNVTLPAQILKAMSREVFLRQILPLN